MKVSVIIPTYNRANLLQRAIRSVLEQSYSEIEIIIVDDGSTDNTSTILEDLVAIYSSIRYLRKANGGCASARNKGLEVATGELITFLDSDDTWAPTAIETLVSRLQQSNAELVYSPSIEIYSNSHETINYPVATERPENLAKEHFALTNVRNGSYLFTRTALQKVGKFREDLKYNEDSDFFQRLALSCRATYSKNPTVRIDNRTCGKSQNRAEIYKALLSSSQSILVDYPEFAKKLGRLAITRIFQIKAKLVKELVLIGDYNEADNIAKDIYDALRIDVRLSLAYRINFIIKFENYIHDVFGNMIRRLAGR